MPTVPLSLFPSEMILGYKESKSLTLNVKYHNTLMIQLSKKKNFRHEQIFMGGFMCEGCCKMRLRQRLEKKYWKTVPNHLIFFG